MIHPYITPVLEMPHTLREQGWSQGTYNLVIRACMHLGQLTDERADVYYGLAVVDGLIRDSEISLLEIMRDTVCSEVLPARSLSRH